MTMAVILDMTSEKLWIAEERRSPCSPIIMRATPRKMEKTIIWSILVLTKDWKILDGKASTMVSSTLGMAWASYWLLSASALISKPWPGLVIFAISSPRATEMAEVRAYSPTTFTPILRSLRRSPRLATPAVMEQNTRGTTIILIMFRKMVPRGFRMVAFSWKIRPITIPRPKPMKVFRARLIFFFFKRLSSLSLFTCQGFC